MCDGAGACRAWANGITCVPESCTGSTYTPARVCNGGGACVPQMTDCTPFACDGTSACKVSCADPSDCAANLTCNAPNCQ